jgi:hypothetical protein
MVDVALSPADEPLRAAFGRKAIRQSFTRPIRDHVFG